MRNLEILKLLRQSIDYVEQHLHLPIEIEDIVRSKMSSNRGGRKKMKFANAKPRTRVFTRTASDSPFLLHDYYSI